jgi:hypothetical protein
MATNQYFRSNYFATDQDQVLAESLITEMIYNYGVDVKYLPRNLANYDALFGEDQSSYFDDIYTIEMYVKNVNGFQGDGQFLSKFGIEIRDEVTFSVSRKRFKEEVLDKEPGMTRPKEGDLIAVPSIIDKRKRLFEITYVNQEEVYYQVGSLYTWELRCKTFELAGEDFNTGDSDIDSVEKFKIPMEYTLTVGNNIDFVVGEQISVANSMITGFVAKMQPNKVTIERVTGGDIQVGDIFVGITSGAQRMTISESVGETSLYQDNDKINLDASGIVLFDEKNPFSEI